MLFCYIALEVNTGIKMIVKQEAKKLTNHVLYLNSFLEVHKPHTNFFRTVDGMVFRILAMLSC